MNGFTVEYAEDIQLASRIFRFLSLDLTPDKVDIPFIRLK